MTNPKIKSADMRSWIQTYWPVGVLCGGLIACSAGYLEASHRVEKTVDVLVTDVQSLKTSIAVVERVSKENRDDTRNILNLLLSRVPPSMITQN